MAKVKLEINKVDFQKIVDDLESKQSFESPSLLWKAVEDTDWAKVMQPRPLTAAIAYTRAKELGITYKTQPGKRGVGLHGPAVKKVPRAEKMKKFSGSFEKMRVEIPVRWHNLIEKAEGGSKTAAIKLKCLDCSCWQPPEIKHCTSPSCSLYPIRPYQGKADEYSEDEESKVESVDT